jgi:hypothetical protein
MRARFVCSAGRAPLVALAALAVTVAAAADPARIPGFVDPQAFIDLFGDDAVTVEVSLRGALLKALSGLDPELAATTRGLESIQAVILELGDSPRAERARALVRDTEQRLMRAGWERLARVQDEGAEVKVLVLNDEEAIQGLVVLVVDLDEGNVVFANVAGAIDLSAIARVGDDLDLPGLDQIGEPAVAGNEP